MSRWMCNCCGTIFDENDAGRYYEDPSDPGVTGLPRGYETYLCCPNCGCDSYDDYDEEEFTDEEFDEFNLLLP